MSHVIYLQIIKKICQNEIGKKIHTTLRTLNLFTSHYFYKLYKHIYNINNFEEKQMSILIQEIT